MVHSLKEIWMFFPFKGQCMSSQCMSRVGNKLIMFCVKQMKNAIKAGYHGMIIYNVETSTRMNFSSAHFPTLSLGFEGIPAVLISNDDGLALKKQYTYSNGFYIIVTPDFPQNLISYLLPF